MTQQTTPSNTTAIHHDGDGEAQTRHVGIQHSRCAARPPLLAHLAADAATITVEITLSTLALADPLAHNR